MNLYYPQHLFLLLVLLPLVLLLVILKRRRDKRFAKYAEMQFVHEYLKEQSPFYVVLKVALVFLALVFIVLALVRPQWDNEVKNVESQGLDIIICMDISRSMDATDLTPTRLTRAKLHVSSFIDQLKGDRVGIIAFAGKATVECPLTDDYKAAKLVLNGLSTTRVVQRGTDIGAALDLAERSFQTAGGNNALLLITDGEDLGRSAVLQAKLLGSRGTTIYTLGVGTSQGIVIRDDDSGREVITKLDEKMLQEVAQAGNGKYYQVTSGQNELDEILQFVYSAERERERSKNVNTLKDQFAIPAVLALLILFLESLIVPLRHRRGKP